MAPTYQTQELVHLFLDHKRAAGRSSETIDNLSWGLTSFQAAFPELPFDKRSIVNYIHSRDLGPTSKRTLLKLIKSFYRWLSEDYDLPEVKFGRVDMPRKATGPAYFSQEEICKVLARCQTPDERALVITLAQTAIRRGELCSIRRSKLYNGWGMVSGKTGERVAYFPREALNALVMAMAGKEQLSHQGIPYTESTATAVMNRLLKGAGVWKKGIGNHAFRHSWQAEYLANGGNPLYVKAIMGHTDATMSEHYRHISIPQALAEAERCAPRRFLQLTLPLAVVA